MHPTKQLLALATIGIVAACNSGGDAPVEQQTFTIDAIGLTIQGPENWDVESRGAEGLSTESWMFGRGMSGVIVRHYDTGIATVEEAIAAHTMGGVIREQEVLDTGGWYFFYDVDFGEMVLPMVTYVIPWPDGGRVICELQLQPDDTPDSVREVCGTVAQAD